MIFNDFIIIIKQKDRQHSFFIVNLIDCFTLKNDIEKRIDRQE
jgi:hypothetical protein